MTSTTVRPTTWGLFVAGLLLALLAAAPARAVCITDELGPDDVPGQKDLNEWCEPGPTCSSSSPTASLKWQFDDVNWTGSNTGDSCALIDTNRDGLADRAICVTVFGAARMAGKCSNNQFLGCTTSKGCGSGGTCIFPSSNTGAPRCYTCGNDRPTRCTNSRPVACTSLCSVGVAVGSDPFSGVASHTAKKMQWDQLRHERRRRELLPQIHGHRDDRRADRRVLLPVPAAELGSVRLRAHAPELQLGHRLRRSQSVYRGQVRERYGRCEVLRQRPRERGNGMPPLGGPL